MSQNQAVEHQYDAIRKSFEEQSDVYNQMYVGSESTILIENRQLRECIGEQISLLYEWEGLAAITHANARRAEALVDQVYGLVFKKEMSGRGKAPSTTEAKAYAQSNDDYVRVKQLHNNTIRLRDEVDAVLNTIKARQYALKDLTNALVAGVESHVI